MTDLLDLRRIANSQGELARAKTVLSERKVSVDTLKEEKLFAVEISRPEDEGVLRESSIPHLAEHTGQKPFRTLYSPVRSPIPYLT